MLSLGFIAFFFHGCGSTTPAQKVEMQPLEHNVIKPTTPSLTIDAPQGATIKILNIKPKYYDGIELEAGNYLIEVSKSGYKTYKELIEVDKPTIHTVSLEKEILSLKIVWSYDHQRFYTLYDPKKGDNLYNGEQSSYINHLAHAHNIALVTLVTEKTPN
ncbi:MAG: PEGA domain-containing protein [Campylobacterales bacterium]|nr:PEGA domain-containing protein [Campylobacterales bacterium]